MDETALELRQDRDAWEDRALAAERDRDRWRREFDIERAKVKRLEHDLRQLQREPCGADDCTGECVTGPR